MKKIILGLMCLASIVLAEDGSKIDKVSQGGRDSARAAIEHEQEILQQQEKEMFQRYGKLLSEATAESVKVYVDDTPKMIAAFKKGERLFCNNQIVSTKKGWMIEDNWLLTKDDHYYNINQCFIKK